MKREAFKSSRAESISIFLVQKLKSVFTSEPVTLPYGLHLPEAIVAVAFVFIWLPMCVVGFLHYPGSGLLYIAFSIASLVMLISGLYKPVGYGYVFLVIFLWLGFWLKLTMHQIFDYPFGEPVGQFDYSATSWDQVLFIAIVGFVGVLVARIIYGLLGLKSTITSTNCTAMPMWYPTTRKYAWIAFFIALVGLAGVNIIYGIQQSGLVPRTILIWPVNALVYWALSTGLAMLIVTILWLEILSRNDVALMAYAIIVEAFFSTVTLLSRGIYVFHVIPAMLSLYKNRGLIIKFSFKKFIIYCFVSVGVMFSALSLVNTLRAYYYSNVPPVFFDLSSLSSSRSDKLRQISFVVDRWVGLEGVMAVSSFPGKGAALLSQAIVEKSEIGKSTRYQDICLAHYRFMNMDKFQFASLPGAIAFFFYSNSVMVVLLGMIAFALFLLCSEKLVSRLTNNPLLNSFWGCAVANVITQFGVAPRGLGPYFLMSALAILAIWVVQSNSFTKFLCRIGLIKNEEN